jgi:hypothetical protein
MSCGNNRKLSLLPLIGASIIALTALPQAHAQTAEPVSRDEVDTLLRRLDAYKAEVDSQAQALANQQRQIDELRRQTPGYSATAAVYVPTPPTRPPALPLDAATLSGLRGTGRPQTAQQGEPDQQPVGVAPPQERPPEINVLADRGGVLTPRGTFVYEPTIDFVHTTSNTAVIQGFTIIPALTIGEINISKINQNIYQAVNTFRYGITDRLEVEARIPYVYALQSSVQRPLNVNSTTEQEFDTRGHDLGDIEAAAHYQINSGSGGWPYFIGNLRVKTATGTDPFSIPLNATTQLPSQVATGSGFYAVEPSLTVIYPSDPAVFFANLGYIYGVHATKNLASIGGVGTASIDPGSAIHLSVGLGFGINEASSFSIGYDYEAFSSQAIGGQTQIGTAVQIGSVLLGYSYRLNNRVSLNLTTAIGTTTDAPNTHVVLRVPIQFQVFGDK